MDRLFLFVIACVSQVGCQTPYAPFGIQSPRVPPPPTGVIGEGAYYSESQGNPSLDRYGPPSISSNIPALRGPGEEINYVGPWRYWETAGNRSQRRRSEPSLQARSNQPSPSESDRVRLASADMRPELSKRDSGLASVNGRESGLTRNDRLAWGDPYRSSTADVNFSSPQYASFAQDEPESGLNSRRVVSVPALSPTTGGAYRTPKPLPRISAAAPIASAPVRVRGFSGDVERQNVAVVRELYDFQGQVRQASGSSPSQR